MGGEHAVVSYVVPSALDDPAALRSLVRGAYLDLRRQAVAVGLRLTGRASGRLGLPRPDLVVPAASREVLERWGVATLVPRYPEGPWALLVVSVPVDQR